MHFVDYLNAPNGEKSSGRLLAAYLIAVGILAFPVGVFVPALAAYVDGFTCKCFGFASVFFGTTKLYDVAHAFKDKLGAFISPDAPDTPKSDGAPE